MSKAFTTRDLAIYFGCTVQSINRYIRKACEAESIDIEAFGARDVNDQRIRTFSEKEVQLISKYVPNRQVKTELEPIQTSAALVPTKKTDGLALFNFGTGNTEVITAECIDVTELQEQSVDFENSTKQTFQQLAMLMKADFSNKLRLAMAQNDHSIKGIQAWSATEALKENLKNKGTK